MVKVGLEVHGYILMEQSKKKLFCECQVSNEDSVPNTNICPICTAQPGSKPMLPNKEAVDKAVEIGLMLGCKISPILMFQRKHYNYPDLPNGYQKTMSGSYSMPVGIKGSFLGIGIQQVHLEEDPARYDPVTGTVDYNRSGMPLIEIVTDPDFKSAAEVENWLKKLMTTLSYIKAISKEAGVKADVNVNIEGHPRVEIKNVNSFSSIVRAINAEEKRQKKVTEAGEKVSQHTRAWDDANGETQFMRSKEQAMDYMFIPEPDLPFIDIKESYIKQLKSKLPERPDEKIKKYEKLGIEKLDAEVLASDIILAELFEKISKTVDKVLTAKWLRREFVRIANYHNKDLDLVTIPVESLTKLFKLIETKKITEKVGQKIMNELGDAYIKNNKDFDIDKYIRENQLETVSDTGALNTACDEVIAQNENVVNDYKSGNEKSINFLVGQVIRKNRGANAGEILEILKKKLA
ncbi:Asp-tRNA(Asn)/Glu-tRNA(Gln) amidotransferase subunit GatB [Candidatus Woesearchaeota archaeon]|nr:Asp-tRNA(Asn)/Glu-tRNA(Gln) amidotransferase subunit GatB [Candidatus Woesearchaeota archaeon]